jgi:uncharacterized protein (DUF697 family)
MSEKEQEALKTTKKYMWLSMGAGLIPVPGVDWAALSGVQLKMIAAISKTYGVPFQENWGKATITSLAGFIVPHATACGWIASTVKLIPVVGVLAGAPAMALLAGGYTWALGNVFIQHFASGGTFLNLDPEKVKEYFQAQFEQGRKMAATMKTAEQTPKDAAVEI